MGNQASLAQSYQLNTSSAVPPSATANNPEPLESYIKEKQRDEHLKNLGFKRSKSLRRSISKKLRKATRRNKKQGDHGKDVPDGDKPEGDASDAKTIPATEIGASDPVPVPVVERLDRNEMPEPRKRARPLVGEPQPLPTHVQVHSDIPFIL